MSRSTIHRSISSVRRYPLVLAATVLVAGAAAATAAVTSKSSHPVPVVASDCGRSVRGPGFDVYPCMSGGARAGHPHPKELLVVLDDGSSVAYPAYGGEDVAAGAEEVVATYDFNLVRVTGSRLVPLLTSAELARSLGVRTIMGIYDLRVDAHGDVYFIASVLRRGRSGCRNPLLERTAGGTIREIRSSTSQNAICS